MLVWATGFWKLEILLNLSDPPSPNRFRAEGLFTVEAFPVKLPSLSLAEGSSLNPSKEARIEPPVLEPGIPCPWTLNPGACFV